MPPAASEWVPILLVDAVHAAIDKLWVSERKNRQTAFSPNPGRSERLGVQQSVEPHASTW